MQEDAMILSSLPTFTELREDAGDRVIVGRTAETGTGLRESIDPISNWKEK